MTSGFFQKGIKNEGGSPAGKMSGLTTAKQTFLLQKRARPSRSSAEQMPLTPQVAWPRGQCPGAEATRTAVPASVSDLVSVNVHQIQELESKNF